VTVSDVISLLDSGLVDKFDDLSYVIVDLLPTVAVSFVAIAGVFIGIRYLLRAAKRVK
jgi:hypothetical protein